MRPIVIGIFAIAIAAANGCWSDQQVLGQPGISYADTDTDTDTDADADTDADTDTDTDTDTDPTQGPVLFGLHNATTMYRYLNWGMYGAGEAFCKPEGGDWGDCSWGLPWCGVDCAAVNAGDNCDMECDMGMAVLEIPPGETYYWTWQGNLYEPDGEHCSAGICYWAVAPEEGTYGLRWTVYPSFDCYGTDCEPDDDWVIQNAWVDGDPTEYSVSLQVVFNESELVITISE